MVGNPAVCGIPQFGKTHTDDLLVALSGLTKEQIEQIRKGFKVHVVQLICSLFCGSWSGFFGGECLSRPPRRNKLFCYDLAPARAARVHLSSRKRQLEVEFVLDNLQLEPFTMLILSWTFVG